MSLSSKPVSDVVRLSDRTHTSHLHDELKTRLHERVVERLDLNSLSALSDERAEAGAGVREKNRIPPAPSATPNRQRAKRIGAQAPITRA